MTGSCSCPPNGNKLIEDAYGDGSDISGTFPTYVAQERVEAGHTYYDEDYGEGAFVFLMFRSPQSCSTLSSHPRTSFTDVDIDEEFAVVEQWTRKSPKTGYLTGNQHTGDRR